MKVIYNPAVDVADILLGHDTYTPVARTYVCDSSEVRGHVILHFDESDRLVMIEVLDASTLLPEAALRQAFADSTDRNRVDRA